MGNYYSYKRISTDTEKQNFNRQIKSLERYATENGIEFLIDFTFVDISTFMIIPYIC